jgi:outer membrane protein TolC
MQARLDQELADPFILRQQLDFIRAASVAHASWVAAGRRWRLSEELLRVANDRGVALTNQAAAGLIPRIVLTDNQRLIVSRRLAVVQARRRFEAAAIALSLFHRDAEGNPLVSGLPTVPPPEPPPLPPDPARIESDIGHALSGRPEIRRFQLTIRRAEVDLRLARNQMLPNLDAGVSVSRDLGENLYKDKSETEVEAGVEFKMPLQRRDARGRVDAAEAQLGRLVAEERMGRDRVAAEIRDVHSSIQAAWEQIDEARRNVELAAELEAAEVTRFERGATDLLSVQIREQASFEARNTEVDIIADYHRSLADYRAAIAVDARPLPGVR